VRSATMSFKAVIQAGMAIFPVECHQTLKLLVPLR
jgi:hypothetical protein